MVEFVARKAAKIQIDMADKTEFTEFTASMDAGQETGSMPDPFDDPEETRVLYAAFDSFR